MAKKMARDLVLWDVAAGSIARKSTTFADVVAFNPDGATLAVGYGDGTVLLCGTDGAHIANLFQKGEVETTHKYTQRVKGIKAFISMQRDKAKEISANKDAVYISILLVTSHMPS